MITTAFPPIRRIFLISHKTHIGSILLTPSPSPLFTLFHMRISSVSLSVRSPKKKNKVFFVKRERAKLEESPRQRSCTLQRNRIAENKHEELRTSISAKCPCRKDAPHSSSINLFENHSGRFDHLSIVTGSSNYTKTEISLCKQALGPCSGAHSCCTKVSHTLFPIAVSAPPQQL